MKKYCILFLLPLTIFNCEKKHIFINELTFYIDGVYYDLTSLSDGVDSNEFGIEGFRYSPNSPLDSLFYYFIGYNVTRENSAYGGQFLDRSTKKNNVVSVPDTSIDSYFWIEIDRVTYDAVSGYIEMINDTNLDKARCNADNNNKAHGTFDFVMVNRENELDTIHVTNGKFKYQRFVYCEQWETY